MSNQANTPAAGGETGITQAQHDAAVSGARAEGQTAGHAAGHAEGLAAGRVEGAQVERTRISGILTHAEAAGRTSLAQHLAFNSDMSVEAAGSILAAGAKTDSKPGSRLDGNVPAPRVDADAPGAGADDAVAGLSGAVDQVIAGLTPKR